jgi:hypothetical protein
MLVHRKLFRLNIILAIFFKLFKELIDIARSRAMNAGYYVKKFDPRGLTGCWLRKAKVHRRDGWLKSLVRNMFSGGFL